MISDLRFALRQWAKNPFFAAVAILSLALGIAGNTTIFSFVNALLLRPPPVDRPGDLWQIWQWRPRASSGKRHGVWGPAAVRYLRENNQSFSALGAFSVEPVVRTWSRERGGESVQTVSVSGNFFDVCGIRPSLGRFFLPEEDRVPGEHPVVVISHAFWRDRLAANPEVVGQSLLINGVALTVVGVAPEAFTGMLAGIAPDLWLPFMMVPTVAREPQWLTRTDSHSLIGFGRLKPAVSVAQAEVDLTVCSQRFWSEVGGRTSEDSVVLSPSHMVPGPLRGYVRSFTSILWGAVVLVLLIACSNAANLQLARAMARRQEMVVRSALGAGRMRLVRQSLVESVLLAVAGGGLGLWLAMGLARGLARLVPATLPIRLALPLDGRVLAFTLGVSLLTGVLFGLAPAIRGARINLSTAVMGGGRGSSVRRSRFANGLIVAQMSLCLVLLLAATLCLRSLLNARNFDPGFETKGRVIAELNLQDFGFESDQAGPFFARLIEAVRRIPEVRGAGLTRYLPLGTEHSNGSFVIDGADADGVKSGFFDRLGVGPGFLAAMGTSLLQGRDFTENDATGAPRVILINEAAATKYWPGINPMGHRLYVDGAQGPVACEIVGVVKTGCYRTLWEDPRPAFFECLLQVMPQKAVLAARIDGDPASALRAIESEVRRLDSRLALSQSTTLEEHLSVALFPLRASGTVLGCLGALALVLAVSGLFGVMAYSVSRRTREVGIRMALGAQPREVRRVVLSDGMKLATAGVVLGMVGALISTRVLRGLLFGISSTDPVAFVLIPLMLLGVAWMACWMPARRASRVDPVVALRAE